MTQKNSPLTVTRLLCADASAQPTDRLSRPVTLLSPEPQCHSGVRI